MTDSLLRVYDPWELGADGYPKVWHDGVIFVDGEYRPGEVRIDGRRGPKLGVKDVIRTLAGDRCERCKHPYKLGSGVWGEGGSDPVAPDVDILTLLEQDDHDAALDQAQMSQRPPLWSSCDLQCEHHGPARARVLFGRPWEVRADATVDDIRRALEQRVEVQAAWRILTVHHLNGHKHDLRWWNLCALCQRCHLEIQNKVQMARVFPFEHTDWFKPHAAGWYAYAYLGEDLTRDETMARLDDLLALELVA